MSPRGHAICCRPVLMTPYRVVLTAVKEAKQTRRKASRTARTMKVIMHCWRILMREWPNLCLSRAACNNNS